MLAGGAPLHAERLAARGGPAGAVYDDRAWFDVSSYGPRAVDAMLRVVGVDRLVLGSDRPVADPQPLSSLGPAVRHAVANVNPSTLLGPHPMSQSPSPRTSSSASWRDIAADPERWRDLVVHRQDERTYVEFGIATTTSRCG